MRTTAPHSNFSYPHWDGLSWAFLDHHVAGLRPNIRRASIYHISSAKGRVATSDVCDSFWRRYTRHTITATRLSHSATGGRFVGALSPLYKPRQVAIRTALMLCTVENALGMPMDRAVCATGRVEGSGMLLKPWEWSTRPDARQYPNRRSDLTFQDFAQGYS